MDEQQASQEQQHTHTHVHGHGCFFCDVAAPQIHAMMDHLWPADTREHFRNARVEILKGMRSMLDAKIERLSKHPAKGTTVPVE